jgi:hypothetical protein
VIFGVLILFCCLYTYFIVCYFSGLFGLAYASFLFMRIILLFMCTCRNLLVKSPLGDVSEKFMMKMFYPFSVGTLTFVRMIETFIEMFCHCFFSFGEDD